MRITKDPPLSIAGSFVALGCLALFPIALVAVICANCLPSKKQEKETQPESNPS